MSDKLALFGRIASHELSPSKSVGALPSEMGMAGDEEFKKGMESLVDNDQLDDIFPRMKHTPRANSLPMTFESATAQKVSKKLDNAVSRMFRSRKSLRAQAVEDHVANASLREFGDDNTPIFIKRLMKEAHSGEIEAQFTLGYCYDVGSGGLKPSTNDAIFWYTKAADQDHPIAQNNLGVIFSTGHRGLTKKDWAEALHWYLKAAEHGNPNAQFHAGLAYMNGEGVEARDDATAFAFYKRAAKQGHVLAMSNVGSMYMGGRGVQKNLKKAYKWLKKAAAKEDAVACHNLGVMYIKGMGVLQDAELGEGYIRRASTGKNSGIIPKDLSLLTKKTGSTLYNS
jgi:TPR repeat protein